MSDPFVTFIEALRRLPEDMDPEVWMDYVEALDLSAREFTTSCVALYGLADARRVADTVRAEIRGREFWN